MTDRNASGRTRAEIRKHNRNAIRRYITEEREARHPGRSGFGGSGGPKKSFYQGSPVSSQSFSSMEDEDNRFAAKLLNPIIEHHIRYYRPGSYFIIEEASLQHTHWEDAERDPQATYQERNMYRLFNKAVDAVERELNRKHPGVEITVNVNPKNRRLRNLYQRGAALRVEEAEANYIVIVKRLEQIEQEHPHKTRAECVTILSNRLKAEGEPGSEGLIRKAIGRVRSAQYPATG